MNTKALLAITIRVIISGLLLGLLFSQSDFGNILQLVVLLNVPLFIVCLFFMLLINIIAAYRWHIFVRAYNPGVSLVRLFSFYLVGLFFNNFLPTAVGGDVVRSYDLYKYSGYGKVAVVSVFMERLAGMSAQVLVAYMAVLIGYSYLREPLILWLVLGVTLAYILFLMVLVNHRMIALLLGLLARLHLTKAQHVLSEMYTLFLHYRSSRQALVQATALSLLIVGVSILTFYLLSIALHLPMPIGYFALFLPIMTIVSMLPISLGGLGVREGIGVFLFSRAGMAPSDAFGLSLGWSSLLILISLLGGVIFSFRGGKRHKLPSRSERMEMER